MSDSGPASPKPLCIGSVYPVNKKKTVLDFNLTLWHVTCVSTYAPFHMGPFPSDMSCQLRNMR